MAEFISNNTKNANIKYILFKLNCGYYLRVVFDNKINFYLKYYPAND